MRPVKRKKSLRLLLLAAVLGGLLGCSRGGERTGVPAPAGTDGELESRTETPAKDGPETGTSGESVGAETGSGEKELAGETEPAGETGEALPAAYDSREYGRAPKVKDQGDLGTCWAFASLTALESSLLPEEEWDFSEDHMTMRNSFKRGQDSGGDYIMSMAYLLAWQGPVTEEMDPYGDGVSPEGLEAVKHVQEIQILPDGDREAIKWAVYENGGVQSSLYTSLTDPSSESRYYQKENAAYFYNGTEAPNHDAVIVGWDDAFPREAFTILPPGDGAFLCVTSWGEAFGDGGYFYVSYYDTAIGRTNLVYTRTDGPDNYDFIYQTDLCGWVGQAGYGEETAFAANVYEAGEKEALSAAGFYAVRPGTSYELYLVRQVGAPGDEAADSLRDRKLLASGTFENAGYYTVDFVQPVLLEAGERFGLVLKAAAPGSTQPIAIEFGSERERSAVNIQDGEGYLSYDGVHWERTETGMGCNICLKGYTRRIK